MADTPDFIFRNFPWHRAVGGEQGRLTMDPMTKTTKAGKSDPMRKTPSSLWSSTVPAAPHTPKHAAGAGNAKGRPFGPLGAQKRNAGTRD